MTSKELVELKQRIEKSKTRVSELKGKKEALLESLKNKFGCSTIEEAEDKVHSLLKKVESLQQKIEIGLKKLKSKYELL